MQLRMVEAYQSVGWFEADRKITLPTISFLKLHSAFTVVGTALQMRPICTSTLIGLHRISY
jgi:hypothetical protein